MPASATPRKPARGMARSFYARAMSEAESAELASALGVDGLDQEIAILRLRLRDLIEKRPSDLELMLRGVGLLARLVATKYKLGADELQDLTRALSGLTRTGDRIAKGDQS